MSGVDEIRLPAPRMLLDRPMRSWLAIAVLFFYLAACWGVYVCTVEPMFGSLTPYSIEADSGAYYQAAGVDQYADRHPQEITSQVGFSGSVIGPAITATIFRDRFNVALFNCVMFLLSIWAASSVPGLQKRTFAMLMIADALTVPTLMTLNKEIFALAGVTLFAKYLYSRNRPMWMLAPIFLLSTMARWQQTIFIIFFLLLGSRLLPFRRSRWKGIAALVFFISAVWLVIALRFKNLLASYLALQKEIIAGTIAHLNSIQGRGGFFLVVWPKILMNVSGRLLQIDYFLNDWIHSDFHDLQNTVIGNLHSIAMLLLLGVMFYKGRFRLAHPLVHFALVYMILTAVSPLVQNRYEYPAYALLAMEMSRRKEALEPVTPLRRLPGLIPSYRAYQERAAATGIAGGPNDELVYAIPLKVGLAVHQVLRRRT